ncbi:MAG: amidase [Pseudomonadota bacterium]
MTERPLWQLSAVELSSRISRGEISATEAVEAAIARTSNTNPQINALNKDMSETALNEAARLDAVFKESGPVGPLHGVPITIKDNVDQRGIATNNGIKAFDVNVASEDAPFVANMCDAGAVVIGRSNTPEFSLRGTTESPDYGRTYNPWNDWATAGGSSGGSSAAVMSGMGAIAHGNDIGGSLRYPSTVTGATTVKPGLGRTPVYNSSQKEERGLLSQLMAVQGVIAREVRDVRLAMRSAVAYRPQDVWMAPVPFEGPPPEIPVKVAFTRNPYEFDLHPEVDKALTVARDSLSDAGYEIVEKEPPNVRAIGEKAWRSLLGDLKVHNLAMMREFGSAAFNAYLDTLMELAPPFEGDELLFALAERTTHIREWQLFLQEYPLVLTPFRLQPTYRWDRDLQGSDGVDNVLMQGFYGVSMNFLGLPAGNICANYNDGLPIGVQIVGRRFREDMILDACEAIEARVGVMAHQLFERQALPQT